MPKTNLLENVKSHFNQQTQSYTYKEEKAHNDTLKWHQKRAKFLKSFISEEEKISFLDIGGGSGLFADILLKEFSKMDITIVDLSEKMLEQNKPHPRKKLICSDAHSFLNQKKKEFNLINFDVMLHHLIQPTFEQNRAYQKTILSLASQSLKANGFISVWELMYETFPFLPRQFSHRFIWQMTTLSLPSPLKGLLQIIGLKSQGAGVCFFDQADLKTLFDELGFTIVAELKKDEWGNTLPFKMCAVQKVEEMNYIVKPS